MPAFIIGCILMSSGSMSSQMCCWAVIFGVPLGILTNQCHKWAHMVHSKPHKIIRFLQKAGLIISHERHHKHHTGQFDTDYCIVNGWMNPFLDYIGFWKKTENLIVKLTGAVPRQDDKYWREMAEKKEN